METTIKRCLSVYLLSYSVCHFNHRKKFLLKKKSYLESIKQKVIWFMIWPCDSKKM